MELRIWNGKQMVYEQSVNDSKAMRNIEYFYKIQECIKSSYTITHLECCERMINNCSFLATGYLSEMALLKKVELLATQYSEVE